jgi:hypothetical protein
MAERVGFEPTERFPAHSISNAANSTTLAPLRIKAASRKAERILVTIRMREHSLCSFDLSRQHSLCLSKEGFGVFRHALISNNVFRSLCDFYFVAVADVFSRKVEAR